MSSGTNLLNLVPPSTPSVAVRNTTSSSVEVAWQILRSRKQPVLGYSINYRREHGEWQQKDLDPLSGSAWITGLTCGSNYSVYMTAYNHIGASMPSTVLATKTEGRGISLIISPVFEFVTKKSLNL